MSEAEIPEWPHKPAPPEPKRLLPPWPLLSRGIALASTSLGILASAGLLAKKVPVAGAALALPAIVIAGLFAWAAAIHLTGGAHHDDHPWV